MNNENKDEPKVLLSNRFTDEELENLTEEEIKEEQKKLNHEEWRLFETINLKERKELAKNNQKFVGRYFCIDRIKEGGGRQKRYIYFEYMYEGLFLGKLKGISIDVSNDLSEANIYLNYIVSYNFDRQIDPKGPEPTIEITAEEFNKIVQAFHIIIPKGEKSL
jgi:hypothetical protein